jgi:hypothetical protein
MLKLSHKRELGKMVDERRAQTVNREDRREKRDERMEKWAERKLETLELSRKRELGKMTKERRLPTAKREGMREKRDVRREKWEERGENWCHGPAPGKAARTPRTS